MSSPCPLTQLEEKLRDLVGGMLCCNGQLCPGCVVGLPLQLLALKALSSGWFLSVCASPFGVRLVNIACVAAVGPEASVLAWELTLGITALIMS